MCTIGSVKNQGTGISYFFKNLDQTSLTKYCDAVFCDGSHYRYLKLATGLNPEKPGVWAGVNEAGVVVLGADGNCMPNYVGGKFVSLNESLVIYEDVLSRCGDAWEAMQYIIRSYQDERVGGDGDIVIVGDRKEAIALEFSPNRWGVQFRGDQSYIIRSNFFLLLESLRPRPEENTLHMSSAVRYSDALSHLSIKGEGNDLEDIFALVRSHYRGNNAMSICRHGGKGEYFTQASLVVELKEESISAFLLVNNSPCKGTFRKITL
jgi:hypothetical protein